MQNHAEPVRNIFAVFGLRSLFFILREAMTRPHVLEVLSGSIFSCTIELPVDKTALLHIFVMRISNFVWNDLSGHLCALSSGIA